MPRSRARINRFNPDAVRAKIKADYLVIRLMNHIEGKTELKLTQIRAIEILLRKCVPDLTSTTVVADVTHRYVMTLPEVLDKKAWLEKYGPKQIDGTTDDGTEPTIQ
jgi:hypothetical protein